MRLRQSDSGHALLSRPAVVYGAFHSLPVSGPLREAHGAHTGFDRSLALCTALACFIKFTPDEQVLDISKVEMSVYKISAVALAFIVSFACGQLLSVLRFFRGL